MVDELLTAVGREVITTVTTKFTGAAWDYSKRWLSSRFANHHPKAIDKGNENAANVRFV